ATNMAGRGTDIQLGGNVDMLVRQSEPEIIAKFTDEAERKAALDKRAAEIKAEVARDREIVRGAGGLYVVGTERHESRRIENQLRFDDVMNSQRKEIYKERIELMATEDVSEVITGMRRDVVDGVVARTIPEDVYAEQWKTAELKEEVQRVFGLDLPIPDWAKE